MKIKQDGRLDEHDQRALTLWAADCAARVLEYFENECPQDHRVRRAIEAGRAWARGEIKLSQARAAAFAAHAAARDAAGPAAIAAARSAGHAVATAHVPGHARHAARYALTAVAAVSDDPAAIATERERQCRCVPAHLRPAVFRVTDETATFYQSSSSS